MGRLSVTAGVRGVCRRQWGASRQEKLTLADAGLRLGDLNVFIGRARGVLPDHTGERARLEPRGNGPEAPGSVHDCSWTEV